MSISNIMNSAVTGASAAATAAASATGSLANSASAFQALLQDMQGGSSAAAQADAAAPGHHHHHGGADTILQALDGGSSTGTSTAASTDPLSALGNLTVAGANSVEQVLGNAVQLAMQAYGSSAASNALPPLSI